MISSRCSAQWKPGQHPPGQPSAIALAQRETPWKSRWLQSRSSCITQARGPHPNRRVQLPAQTSSTWNCPAKISPRVTSPQRGKGICLCVHVSLHLFLSLLQWDQPGGRQQPLLQVEHVRT